MVSKGGEGDAQRLREVWHGSRASAAAIEPPLPPHLASVTALTHLQLRGGEICRVSKRDARCCFDQLILPEPLREWMARPPLSEAELCREGGMTASEVRSFIVGTRPASGDQLFPVPMAWPMGFSWSSFIAQSTMLGICRKARLTKDSLLSADLPTPSDGSILHAVATDDIMLLSTGSPGSTLEAAGRVDEAMASIGMLGHAAKSIDDSTDAMCIGIALEGGVQWAAPPERCLSMLLSVVCLLQRACASPLQVHQCLGVLQWYDLLVRSKLSIYQCIYRFVRDPKCSIAQALPAEVRSELLMGIALGIFWVSDMRRPLLPLVCCSDASTGHGFGGSVLRTSDSVVQKLAQLACKHDSVVAFGGPEALHRHQHRAGNLEAVQVDPGQFAHIFSIRKRHGDHINMLEGEAMLILLRWLLRSVKRHHSRIVVLLDSSVILGASAKGRSSTRINRIMRRSAALQLAGDLQIYWVLVPSHENPSDMPSRGRWTRARL